MVGFTRSRAGAAMLAVVVATVANTRASTIFVDAGNCPLSDCCVPHSSPGCDDRACEALVCAVVPVCCADRAAWAQACANLAFDLCGLCRLSGGSGTEADPYCSIQTAIDNAVETDEVVVAPGTYFETVNFLGKAITVRSTDPQDPVVVANTVIDGRGNLHVVQCVSGEGPETVLEGFTITGGNANGSTTDDRNGGGMYNNASSPTVRNCMFTGNSARRGGGMSNILSSPTVTGCAFSSNLAGDCGGMANDGSSPTVTNCTFDGNWAASSTFSNGGGMCNHNDSSPTVTDCTFAGNTASFGVGGAMHNDESSPTVTDCTFSGNSATSNGGGGMFNSGGSPTVRNCTFCDNTPEHINGQADLSGQIHMSTFCPIAVCPGDIDGDGTVGIVDFLELLADWGTCP